MQSDVAAFGSAGCIPNAIQVADSSLAPGSYQPVLSVYVKPRGPRLCNGEAWFTTDVVAEARPTMALLKRLQKAL